MEKEYQNLKEQVGFIFSNVKDIILNLPGIDKNKIEMNLQIIQAVVMRFIRMIIYRKQNGILCTSPNEIIKYATTSFLKHIPQNDNEDRQKIKYYVSELQRILTMNKELKY